MSKQPNSQITDIDLENAVAAMPSELSPKRDLWAGIEQAVAKTPQEKPWLARKSSSIATWSKVAAAVLPVAIVAGLLMQNQTPVQSGNEMPWLAPTVASFQIQKQNLLRQVAEEQQVSSNYDATMKDLEEAERALKIALKNQPGDPALMRMLNAVYQQQLALIAKSHQPKFDQI